MVIICLEDFRTLDEQIIFNFWGIMLGGFQLKKVFGLVIFLASL
jgi:hypothetical protein